jgi:hypothetical protein
MKNTRIGFIILLIITAFISCSKKAEVTPEEARQIAKESYIYGLPLVDSYRIMYSYIVDKDNPEYKAPWNTIKNMPKVFTPADKAIQTPNSDTPYSMAGLDLRAEPIILTIPPIEKSRYFSIQLVDMYTFNFDYLGSRTTGNEGGNYMIVGPNWKGEAPDGITKVFRSETEFVLAVYRTQLFNPADLSNVIKIQEGYKLQTLSEYSGQPAPASTPQIDFIKPLSKDEQKTSTDFFKIVNFVLQYCPTVPSEADLMQRFAKINVGGGLDFNFDDFSPEVKQAIKDGMEDARKELSEFEKNEVATGKVSSGDMFGTREYLKNNYLYRFAAAELGIYGNSEHEAMYPMYREDSEGNPLNGKGNKYIMYLPPDNYPPVNAFWSITMYDLPASLLVENPINRYLINSPMLPDLKKDMQGGITIYFQHESPGKEKESNWLPAPDGPFWVVMRLYWPKESALNGSWRQPALELVKN